MTPVPLLDHFHPPLSRTRPWRAFHGAWAAATARLLNAGGLPPGYYAVPFLDRDGPVEVDLAALDRGAADTPATGDWQPDAPGVTVAVEWPAADDVRVEVLSDDGDPRLAAAVEFVSPRNKDRPKAREAFAAKCAGYLSRGCGLVVVDVVTTRRGDPHADLLAALGAEPPAELWASLAAVAYRPAADRLQVWPAPLELGRPLPTVPLWLAPDLSVRLDLHTGYTAACADLAIRPGDRPA